MRSSRAARAAACAAALVLAGCAARGPQLPPVTASGLPARVELESTPFFPQQDYQCGPAALATVLVASGAQVAPDELVAEIYLPGRKGSLQAELIAATRARGRLPYLLPPSFDDLLAQLAAGHPVLVLQKTGAGPWPGWHYAVVIGYDAPRDRLLLRSGTESQLVGNAFPCHLGSRRSLGHHGARAGSIAGEGGLWPLHGGGRQSRGRWPARRCGACVPRCRAALAGRIPATARTGALANIALARGDEAVAQRELRAALSLAPDDVAARNNLAEVLRSMGCLEAARREIAIAAKGAEGGPLAAAVASTQRRIDASSGPDGPGCPAD